MPGGGVTPFESAPDTGWNTITLSNETITQTNSGFSTSGSTNKDDVNGVAIQKSENDYLILFRNYTGNFNDNRTLLFNINASNADVKLFIEGTNSISVVNGGIVKVTNGKLYINIASSSSLAVHTQYNDSYNQFGGYNSFDGNVSVIGEDRSTSVLSFDNTGAQQSTYSVALNSCINVSNVTVNYDYASEFLVEDPDKTVSSNGPYYNYSQMCHKVFMQGTDTQTTISNATIDVDGAYWGFNIGTTVIEDSYVDVTACDVAFSVQKSMSIKNSTVNASTLWTMAWSDGNGGTEGANHIPAGLSIGSPGNGNTQSECTLSIDADSTVNTMGVRFYNNTVADEGSLDNDGNLTINPSSFDDSRYPSLSGYGMTSSQNYKSDQTPTTSAFSFVNDGHVAVNAPIDVSAKGDDVRSELINNSYMDLNSDITVGTGSQAVNTGYIVYTDNATGMDNIVNQGGTIEAEPEPTPGYEDDDDFVPPYIPQQSSDDDDSTLYIACCAAAAVVALLAIIIVMNERRR